MDNSVFWVYLGKECDYRCLFCPHMASYDKQLGFEKNIIEDKSNSLEILEISGKNPINSSKFLKFLNDSYDRFKSIIILTPGYVLLDSKLLDELEKYKEKLLFKITVLSHRRDVHDTLTHSRDSWLKDCKALMILNRKGFKVMVNTILTKINYCYIKDMPFFIKTLGFSEWEISYPKPLGKAKDNIEMLMPSTEMTLPFLEDAIYFASKNNINIYFRDIPFCILKRISPKNFTIQFSDNNNLFEKSILCKDCLKNNECKGFFKKYFEMFDIKAKDILKPLS
ncbi:MAG TPA: hypothetical protein PLX15_05025 [Candidatus Woesearchaeota archaeon]|nr:hypothetical protein [Candidatus Woesearchaeota archaeon]